MSTHAPATSSARLLVVDDDERISSVITKHLERLGYPFVATVTSAAAAVAAVAADHPDLVLMDIDLNGPTDGADAAQRIRDEYGIPVIFVSGNLTRELISSQDLPAFAHVPKPIDRDQLAIAVNTGLTLGANARWHRLQAAIGIALATLPDLESVLRHCADALVNYLGVSVAQISILDREGAVMALSATSGSASSGGDAPSLEISPDMIGELVRGREPVFTDTRVSQPLIVENVVVGVMILLSQNPLPSSTPALLTPLCDMIAVGIQRKQLELEARAQSDQLGLMHTALSTVVSTNDWNLASRLLLLGIMARLHAPRGVFGVVSGSRLDVLASEGIERAFDSLALEGVYGSVVSSGQTVCAGDFLGVPLKSEGRVIGIIGLTGPPDGFTHADQTRVEAQAQLAGVMCQAYVTHRQRAELERELARARETEARALAQANEALQKANQDLEERVAERTAELTSSNQDLERFAYVSSHDLQEPLRVVTSYVQLLARRYGDRLDEDAHRFIGHAVTGVTRMQTLINDLLSFSRVGSRPRAYQRTSMNAVVAQTLENLASAIEESGAEIKVDRLPDVSGDETQLVQLFQNLVANAIKFRAEAKPTVRIDAIPGDAEHEFRICDNGIGIEPQYFDRIFIIFQRLHGPTKYTGTGIGLAICKKIVERHGGRIWVTTGEGCGTVFHFTLKSHTEVRGP